jgi:hypothetical protein
MSTLLSLSNECLVMLFAVKYGVTIMRAMRTFLVAGLMATTAWTSTHAFERVDLIGGADAFVAVAENFNSCGNAITKKLIAEIAQAEPVSAASHDG